MLRPRPAPPWHQGPTTPRTAITELDRAALNSNTVRADVRPCRRWDEWRGDRPEADATVATYVDHLFEAGKSPATIDQAVAAIRYRAKFDVRPIRWASRRGARLRVLAGRAPTGAEARSPGLRWEDTDKMALVAAADGGGSVGRLRDRA